MKKSLLLLVLVLWIFTINIVSARQVPFKNQPKDSVTRSNLRMAANEYVPGELIVKFKDNLTVKSTGAKFKSASVVTDALQTKYNVQKAEALFPGESRLKSAQMLTAPNGKKFPRPSLHNIFKLKIADEKQLMNAISDFKADTANVVYAEPNYIVSICNDKPVGPILTTEDVQKMQLSKTPFALKTGTDPIVNDPLYNQQWYIPAVKADLVWPQTKGDTTQIIAILDTGVDWLHPDLKNKIWMNPNPSKNSWPDGIVNDIRGWDFINNDNNPTDDNSHGTHVSGIAAAETNNGIGIAGMCPNAKIMPVKVFSSDGHGDVAIITKGIIYAMERGATVINMSFGTYWRSLTMENALANAYSSAVLVASAGNDQKDIYDFTDHPYTCYPAALPFVLGVQADGNYSNYDSDGPIYSRSEEGLNYELKAPGTNISTVPGGTYRIMSGTSMSAPVISGAVALYLSYYPQKSREDLWGDFIHSSSDIVNLQKAFFEYNKTPKLDLISSSITDTSVVTNDKDNQADAGEILNIVVKVRNTWAPAKKVYAKLVYNINSTKTDVEILKDSVYLGSIGVYGQLENKLDPFKIKIKSDCFHNRNITLDVIMKNIGDTLSFRQSINFKVYNASEIGGIILRDTTWTPDKNWAINNSLRIASGVTVTILPGTHVEINAGVDNRGCVNAIGNKDSLIYFKGSIGGNCIYKYVDFDLCNSSLSGKNIENCIIRNGSSISGDTLNFCFIDNYYEYNAFSAHLIKNSLIQNSFIQCIQSNFDRCILYNIRTMSSGTYFGGAKFTVFNKIGDVYSYLYPNWPTFWRTEVMTSNLNQLKNNTFLDNNKLLYFVQSSGNSDYQNFPGQYWGTTNKAKIKKKYIDFNDNAGLPYLMVDPILITPSDSCHGHVWKVLVNGKDVQDETVDPLGVGKHRFDVYFNRPMNKNITPKVTFGVRFPYSQVAIDENGSWSVDGKIYTVYKTINLTSSDGINRIRVANAKESNGWDWEIPIEDSRFEFILSAAGSASAEFMAIPSLGKVKLEWNNHTLTDGLGYNMYRMEHINDTTLTKPALVNKSLISDTLFTDFDVTPNKKYYYFYKILRTDLSETDSSKVVSATPFTASKGDANGDLSVNVLDITSIVSYLLGQNPTPFIFEAADVNGDKAVNVLDVVSVANVIKGVKSSTANEGKNYNPTLAYITLKPEIIQLKSDAQVQAIQFELQGVDLEKVNLSAALKGFELAYALDSNKIKGVLYNLTGLTVPAGIYDIIKIESGAGKLTWGNVFGADPQGRYVTIMKKEDVSLTTETSPFGLSVQPNPSSSDMQISYRLPEKAQVTVKVFNIMGELVSKLMDNTLPAGTQQLIWNGNNTKGETVKPGVYFIRIDAKDEKNNSLKEQIKVVRL